jgi:hypothetical protein
MKELVFVENCYKNYISAVEQFILSSEASSIYMKYRRLQSQRSVELAYQAFEVE